MSRFVSGRLGMSNLTEAELPVLLPYKEIVKVFVKYLSIIG